MSKEPIAETKPLAPKTLLVLGFWRLGPYEQTVLLNFYRASIASADQSENHVHDGNCSKCASIKETLRQLSMLPPYLVDEGWTRFEVADMRRILRLAAGQSSRST